MNRVLLAGVAAASLMAASLPALCQNPHAPFAGAARGPEKKDPAVEKLTAEAMKLEKQLKAKPKDTKLRLQVAEAWYKAGYALEYSKEGLMPRTRYRGALVDYRKALAYNPGHKAAAKEKKQIEDIYQSMHMPIPK